MKKKRVRPDERSRAAKRKMSQGFWDERKDGPTWGEEESVQGGLRRSPGERLEELAGSGRGGEAGTTSTKGEKKLGKKPKSIHCAGRGGGGVANTGSALGARRKGKS